MSDQAQQTAAPPLPTSTCPDCGYQLDAATDPKDESARPVPGCLSVCINCSAVLTFASDMTLRPSTLEERSAAGPELERYVAIIAQRGRFG